MILLAKKRLVLLAVMLALGAALAALWLNSSDEPCYQGRKLSAWLTAHRENPDDARAIAAIRAIGTNAVPYLLQGFSYSYLPRREGLIKAADIWIRHRLHLTTKLIRDPLAMRYERSVAGFKVLGPIANPALPDLSKLLGSTNGAGAAIAMSGIGPPALPFLIEGVRDASPDVRYHGLIGVAQLGTNAGPALPAVVGCFGDTNVSFGTVIRYTAILAATEMGAAAREAEPALKGLLQDPDGSIVALAKQALDRINSKNPETAAPKP